MDESFSIAVDGTTAQDLYFVETAVDGVTVNDEDTPYGSSHGLPGIVEAVIVAVAADAVRGVIAWLLKRRKKGVVKIRREISAGGSHSVNDVEIRWNESDTPDDVVARLDEWLADVDR